MYSRVSNDADCRKLQKDLDSLYQWSITWQLSFNVNKCKSLSIIKRNCPLCFKYTLNGTALQRVNEYKDLDVIIDCKLNWNSHIYNAIKKLIEFSVWSKEVLDLQHRHMLNYSCIYLLFAAILNTVHLSAQEYRKLTVYL